MLAGKFFSTEEVSQDVPGVPRPEEMRLFKHFSNREILRKSGVQFFHPGDG